MEPGPSDPSVLRLQATHRSTAVWSAAPPNDSVILTCRRHEGVLWPPHPRIVPYLQRAGFYGLSLVPFIRLDWHLITALVERWRPETHTFHFTFGEATITLQDVNILLGLPVDGCTVTGTTDHKRKPLCTRLLGLTPRGDNLNGSRLSLTWLLSNFHDLADDANEEKVCYYARAYILLLIGGRAFTDKSGKYVNLMFLPLLEDLDKAGEYSWGSAALAWLYRELCRASRTTSHEIAGAVILLQVWAWERFPHIAPCRTGLPTVQEGPLISRWRVDFKFQSPTHVLGQYRYSFDTQTPDQVVWQPYTPEMTAGLPEYCMDGACVWRTVAPLICFFIVETCHVDRVVRQFGFRQLVPQPCDTLDSLHCIDLRGTKTRDWALFHSDWIALWAARQDHIVTGAPWTTAMEHYDPYMVWYRCISHLYIGREGYTHEFVTRQLVDICEVTPRHPRVYEMAVDALTVLNQQHRLAGVQQRAEALEADPDIARTPFMGPDTQTQTVGIGTDRGITKTQSPLVSSDPSVSSDPPQIPISWPPNGALTLDWVVNLMHTFEWASWNLSPSEFPFVLPVQVFDNLVHSASKILQKEPNCVKINDFGPDLSVVVVGEVHGQLHDVNFLLQEAGFPADNRCFVFNGDYVDRGAWGLETFIVLLAWKVFMPHRVYLLRGNHETKYCTSIYGFEKEVLTKYGDPGKHVYRICLDCFKVLPLASIVAGCVYTAHGGIFRSVATAASKRSKEKKSWKKVLNPEANSLSLGSFEELSEARRFVLNPPCEGANLIPGDVLWSDPQMSPGLFLNEERGMGLLWGPDCTEDFLKKFNLKLIIRSHEGPDVREERSGLAGMDEGYNIDHVVESGKLITLFSAPDYPRSQETEDRYNNKGAYIVLEGPHFDLPAFHTFRAVPRPKVNPY